MMKSSMADDLFVLYEQSAAPGKSMDHYTRGKLTPEEFEKTVKSRMKEYRESLETRLTQILTPEQTQKT